MDLKGLIDWDAIMPMERFAGGHDEQMKGLFKGATVLAHWNEGDYQGQIATAVRLEDGRFVCYGDCYGSCSGCDAWECASDETVRELCIELADSAKAFDTIDSMIAYIETDGDIPRQLAEELRKSGT